MEFNNIESKALETTTIEAMQQEVQLLDDLQLLMVGGGNVIVTLG
jgi:hypothetical protein